MRALERFMLLQIIDERWREHLHDMDYLREGIHLRGFAQIEPLVAYKNEGFEMFTGLMNAIWEEFARYIFHVEVEVEGAERRRRGAGRSRGGSSSAQLDGRPQLRGRHRRPTSRARWAAAAAGRRRGAGRASQRPRRRGRRDGRAAAAGRDAARRRGGADRPQRPVLVRLRQEVQEVPWRLAPASATS